MCLQRLSLKVVRLAGVEPATLGLEVRCSIQLSYRRPKNLRGTRDLILALCAILCVNSGLLLARREYAARDARTEVAVRVAIDGPGYG